MSYHFSMEEEIEFEILKKKILTKKVVDLIGTILNFPRSTFQTKDQ